MTEQANTSVPHRTDHHLRPHVVAAGRGFGWWRDAWSLFKKHAGIWVVMTLIPVVILAVLGLAPVLGGLVIPLLLPLFAGSWMLAARKADTGGTPEVGDLFGGIRRNLSPLLVLGALMLAASLAIALLAGLLGAGAILHLITGAEHHRGGPAIAAVAVGMLGVVVAATLSLLLSMAAWHAPALVVFRDVRPVRALSASLTACLKNVVPFVLYSVLFTASAVVASIPFGLGWLVLLPLAMLTVYVSYKDVFGV